MPNHSTIIQIGHLTRDPEQKFTPSGKAVAKCGIATNHRYGSGESAKDEVCFVDFELWGQPAESIAKHARKGDAILIEGRLKMDTWDDKTTGQKRSKHVIAANRWSFMGGAKPEGQAPSPTARQPRPATPTTDLPADDDVPF